MTEQMFKDAARWLEREGYKVDKVTSIEEDERDVLVCGEGTCWDSYTEIRIEFIDSEGNADYELFEGDLTEFIKELTTE